MAIKYYAEFANNAWCWLSNIMRSLPTTLVVGYQIFVAEFANNAWCWLSNLWRSFPTTLGVGFQIFCGGVRQHRLVLVIKYYAGFANNAWCWL
jgi:hypothetical protein